MEQPDQREYLMGETGVARDLLGDLTKQYLGAEQAPDAWDVENYTIQLQSVYDFDAEHIDFENASAAEIETEIWEKLKAQYATKEAEVGPEAMRT